MAGNLLQRTRCPHLRDPAQACNKREPGTGCVAIGGFNRLHGISGQTDKGRTSARSCVSTHLSDLAVALAAHEAVVVVEDLRGPRSVTFEDLHRLPGDTPHLDTNLQQDDLVVAIELPAFADTSHHLGTMRKCVVSATE